MMQSALQFILMRELTGKELLGASTDTHLLTLLPTADGRIFCLDRSIWELKLQQDGVDKPLVLDKSFYEAGETNYRKYNLDLKPLSWLSINRFVDSYTAGVYTWLVGKQSDQKDYTHAEAYYQEALRLNPDNPDYHNNYALLLAKQPGRQDEAENHYKEAVKKGKMQAWYLTSYAQFLLKQSRFQEALNLYNEALDKTKQGQPNWLDVNQIEDVINLIRFVFQYLALLNSVK